MDGTGGNSVPQIHERFRRLEHGYRMLGGDVVRREAILELVESRCDKVDREGLQASSADGLSGSDLSADARLLAERAHPSADLCQSHTNFGQAYTKSGYAEKNRSEQVKAFTSTCHCNRQMLI